MPAARTALRRTLELVATTAGITTAARRAHHRRVAILAYHNVVPPDDAGHGDTSLHLTLPRFIRQIERLRRTHDIVHLDAALSPHEGRRPRAVITFDDAYRGALTLALPELIRRGLPATVFVAPALLGASTTWWDALGAAGLLSDTRRNAALTHLQGRAAPILRDALPDRTTPRLPDSYGIASLAELRRHCTDGVVVGSHAWAHEHLPSLATDELTDSLSRTLAWLDAFEGASSRWLALPYGAGSSDVARIAMDMGHTGVLRISGGLWDAAGDRADVPRINVPAGMSWRGLELRTSGLLARG